MPPSVLGDLIAAGLVSHEMIGDPARLGGETAALHALCGLVAGPVYRIDAYHYAFRAGPGDLGGRLGEHARPATGPRRSRRRSPRRSGPRRSG